MAVELNPTFIQRVGGDIVGNFYIRPLSWYFDRRARKIKVNEPIGLEHLKDLPEDKPAYFLATHQPPGGSWLDDFARKRQFVVAAFVLKKFLGENGIKTKTVVEYNHLRRKSQRYADFEHRFFPLPLRRQAFIRAGYLAANVEMHDPTFNKSVTTARKEGNSPLVFPEHMHHLENTCEWETPEEEKLIQGTVAGVILSRAPLVPIVVRGDERWRKRKGEPVQPFIGEPLYLSKLLHDKEHPMSVEDCVELVKTRFRELRNYALNYVPASQPSLSQKAVISPA